MNDFNKYHNEVNNICLWSDKNCLVLNPQKTNQLVFDFNKRGKPYGKNKNIIVKNKNIVQTQ